MCEVWLRTGIRTIWIYRFEKGNHYNTTKSQLLFERNVVLLSDNTKVESEDKAVLFYRSLSAPSHLHRSLSLQEGAKDLRRLQRWRTAVQKKNNLLSQTSHPEGGRRSMDYGTIVDDIFAFIGSDSDNAVCDTFPLGLFCVFGHSNRSKKPKGRTKLWNSLRTPTKQ